MIQVSALTILAATATTHADGIAFWFADVTTDDGDQIVEAGETADITLSILMDPNTPGFEALIGATIFDTLGDDGAANGEITDWFIHNNLADLTGDLTTTDGVSLYGTHAGQLCAINSFFAFDNPVDVITITWAPVRPGAYDVSYATMTGRGDSFISVYEYNGDGDYDHAAYPILEVDLTFSVDICPADANGDGDLDILDFVAFQQAWQSTDPAADCDDSGAFDILDFICFQSLFNAGCEN